MITHVINNLEHFFKSYDVKTMMTELSLKEKHSLNFENTKTVSLV